MRIVVVALVVLLLAAAAYAYTNNPAACAKLGTDLVAVFEPPQVKSAPAPVAPAPAATSPAPSLAAAPQPPVADPAAPTPPVAAVKPWSPPAVIPAQPNWTWQTLDGTTYQNVVITKIEPETVSITHSLGVAHLPMVNLPPDIQKLLNYDPEAARAARDEADREARQPFFELTEMADAQSMARQLNRPLAWLCSDHSNLTVSNPSVNSDADLTQMAVDYLKSRAITIFLEGNDGLGKCPAIVREQGFFQMDDGPIPGGHHFYSPKVVFTDADVSKVYGRAWSTEMKETREIGIQSVLDSIH